MTEQQTRQIIVLNAGSSTVKGALFEVTASECVCRGRASRVLGTGSDPTQTFADVLDYLTQRTTHVEAIAHRVVHGGDLFHSTVEIDPSVETALESLSPLAPVHNPLALAGIRFARGRFPASRHFGVFDTAFHAERSPESMRYPLPEALCEEYGLRRYGFHGIAHAALIQDLAAETGADPDEVTAVTLQLGSGCSACAVKNGRSIETSMGVSPLGGLPMASRAGDLDPGVLLALLREGWSLERIERLLTSGAGLQGISGRSDMQDLLYAEAVGDRTAALAIAHFVRAVVLLTGAYLTLLEGRGAIVFGGGIGTNSSAIRQRIAAGLSAWNVDLEVYRNRITHSGIISSTASRPVYVFETDEERVMAQEILAVLAAEAS